MSLLLLAFGALLTASGILLAAFGVSIHDHTFDTSLITPGVVASVGGLLLIGLGLALRVLQRIERAIAVRSTQRAEPALAPQPERTAPPQPLSQTPRPQPAPAAAPATIEPDHPADEASQKSPLIARLEATRVMAETEASRSPNSAMPFPSSVDIAVAQVEKTPAVKRTNGAAALRTAQRLDVVRRPAAGADRTAGPSFDALWPKTPRPAPAGQLVTAPTPPAALPMATEPEPESTVEAVETAAPAMEAEPVSVLKSGVVDGMAYTLYSDGSIEAQLPQGMLRFGSIAELRNHIERSA